MNGYTLGAIAVSNILETYKVANVGYSPNDYLPIGMLAAEPSVLVVPATSPYKTATQFFAAARTSSLSVAGGGTNTVAGLTFKALASSGGLNLKYIPFTGNSQSIVTNLLPQC